MSAAKKLDAAMALSRADVPMSVINPRSAHHFAEAMLQRSKTDRIDAGLLAEYARRMYLTLWLALRDISRRINQLTGMCTTEKNRLHALKAQRHTSPTLIEKVEAQIELMEASIQRLTASALALIEHDADLARYRSCLITTKGIADASAVTLIGELCLLPRDLRSTWSVTTSEPRRIMRRCSAGARKNAGAVRGPAQDAHRTVGLHENRRALR